jgi:hypothetical protein
VTRSFRVLALLTPLALSAASKGMVLEVDGGAYDRGNTPVVFQLPESLRKQQHFMLTELDTKRAVDVQVDRGRILWIIRDKLPAGQTRRYRLAAVSGKHQLPAAVTADDDGQRLLIKIANRPVLQYNKAVVPSPDPRKPEYRRSGYLHPVYDPDGRPVTDDMAPDHMHQHGVMFAYEKATFEGRAVNFWEPANGSVEHEAIRSTVSGPVFAEFEPVLRHMVNDAPGGPRQALRETWRVRVYNITDFYLFDIESVQEAATDSPLVIEKNSYGGLAIRCHRNWFDPKNSEYLTSEGGTRKDGNQTRPQWVDLHGWIDGRISGVTILDHPGNLQFPQPVRLHPEKPYFCFAPMALGPFRIEPGRTLTSRYRFYIHTGKPDARKIEAVWHDYSEPPQVRIISGN